MIPDRYRYMAEIAGAELRDMREKAGLSQEAVADIFDISKSAMGKIELGINAPSLVHYLVILNFLKDVQPDHPGIPLAAHLLKKPRRPHLVQADKG